MDKETIDLLQYLPEDIITQEEKKYPLHVQHDEISIGLSYQAPVHNGGQQEFSCTIQRYITKNERTFEVIGLLQAEMGKTQNGNLSFANHEYQIINRVVNWFEKELHFDKQKWKWSIKVNINEPTDSAYKQLVELKVIDHWTTRAPLTKKQAYPKKVTYVNEDYTKNKRLKHSDYGTLVLEYKNNLFSQIIKNFVRKMTYEQIVNEKEEYIRGYMRGIIAGEGCIEIDRGSKKYRVHISVTKKDEKDIYCESLLKLGIDSIEYPGDKLVISKRKNNTQLLIQKLVTISHEKYAKFLTMMQQYPDITKETGYFIGKRQHNWNKHPQEKIDKIIELYKNGTTDTKEIAKNVGVSAIKVNRVLRENNLGKRRVPNYTEEFQLRVVAWIKENPTSTNEQVASVFNTSKEAVRRIRVKYKCQKPRKLLKATQEQIEKVIQLYQQNPSIRFKEVMRKIGISDTTLKNIRKKYGLTHLGYKRKVGCNNTKTKEVSFDGQLEKITS